MLSEGWGFVQDQGELPLAGEVPQPPIFRAVYRVLFFYADKNLCFLQEQRGFHVPDRRGKQLRVR